MIAIVLFIAAALLLGGLLWLAASRKGLSEEEMFRRFDAIQGFTITERHHHKASGLAADETRGVVAVVGKESETVVLLGPRDLTGWRYVPKDGHFEMSIKSRRHREPFIVTFRKSATADEWLKIFKKLGQPD
ncbi:MAG TPA: hypothetical protein VEB20_03540 [Azospirillaceae bacterium]|nr:hypothetical protein [Azospirillaceae bacterium]